MTIESDAPLVGKHFLAENPSRLVIDVDGLELSPQLRELVGKVKPDDPFIAGVRVGQSQPRIVRLVLDLKQATAPQLFTLAPVAAYRHRLVFDLHPVQGARSAARPDPRQGAGRGAGSAGGAGCARRVHRPHERGAPPRRPRRHRAARLPRQRLAAAAGAAGAAGAGGAAGAERRRRSTAWSSSPSTRPWRRGPGAIGPSGLRERTWCWRSRCSCATASTPTRRCGRC